MSPDPREIFDRDATHVWTGAASGRGAVPGTRSLSLEERARTRTLPAPRAGWYAATRTAVREVLGRYLEQPPGEILLGRSPCPGCGSAAHGPPAVLAPATTLTFSLSYSGPRWLLALTSIRPLGVDVQEVLPGAGPDLTRMAASCFAPDELGEFQARSAPASRAAYFYRAWTRKEAVVKAMGVGLAADLTGVHVSAGTPGPAVVRTRRAGHTALWQVEDLPVSGGPGFAALAREASAAGPVRFFVHEPAEPDPEIRQNPATAAA
ncbi:4'-phosphopantetheinyl transferase family protein [Streptomyces xanthophaeus]|uniref:4'-phosphopantetheinyl transferase family protein n=1 Tax=Streptomyces xanthophaeus TaxID=67385 RepID=UPI002649BBEC|nr:4'-phosphopantetheinyl transferase superfamily protein [Streptomyces xanthophaeus]WKD32132.1 4'-phosphopantetheinyl transferase superfamily protein [Streptomyces xanthophaeus]